MTDETPRTDAAAIRSEKAWFDEARVVDAEWVELSVTTADGEHVYYRVPRRTHFRNLDDKRAA